MHKGDQQSKAFERASESVTHMGHSSRRRTAASGIDKKECDGCAGLGSHRRFVLSAVLLALHSLPRYSRREEVREDIGEEWVDSEITCIGRSASVAL